MSARPAVVFFIGAAMLLAACGQRPADVPTTANAPAARTLPPATPAPRLPPAVATEADAIRIARAAVSPYLATWQDVVATEERGIWRVAFRHFEPLPPDAPALEEYWRAPLVVSIDAQTGIVLRQEYA